MFSTLPTSRSCGPASPFALFNPSARAQAASDLKTLCSSSSSRKPASARSTSSSSLIDVFGPILPISRSKSKHASTSTSLPTTRAEKSTSGEKDEPFITWPETYTASKPSYRTPDYSPESSPKSTSSQNKSTTGRRLRKQRSQAYYDRMMYGCVGMVGFHSESESESEFGIGEGKAEQSEDEQNEEDEEFIQYPTESIRSYLNQSPSPPRSYGKGLGLEIGSDRDSQLTLINPSPPSSEQTLYSRRHAASSRPPLSVETFIKPQKRYNASPALTQTTLVEEEDEDDGASSVGELFMTSELELKKERVGAVARIGGKGDRWGGNWV